jgi:hypothetical protein
MAVIQMAPIDNKDLSILEHRINANPPLESFILNDPMDRFVKQVTPNRVAGVPIINSAKAQESVGNYFDTLSFIESTNNPKAVSPAGAKGLYQFMPETAKQYGLDDPFDPVASRKAVEQLTQDNEKFYKKIFGKDPTDAERYLMHQQGAKGATTLLQGGNRNAVDVLTPVYKSKSKAQKAIEQNGGNSKMSAKEFADLWLNKYNEKAMEGNR